MTRDEIVEVMASAMDPKQWEVTDAWGRAFMRANARHALSALEAAGLVVVPREPTPAMCKAALDAVSDGTTDEPQAIAWDAVRAYRAMIAAGEKP